MKYLNKLILSFFIFVAVYSLNAQNGDGLYLLSEDGLKLAIVEGSQIVKEVELPIKIQSLHPTPGGGYLFLLGADGNYLALNGVNRKLEKEGQFPLTEIEWLTFSPTGHELFVSGDNQVLVFDHQKGEPVNPRETDIPHGRTISFNRRGTRYYINKDNSLEYRLVKDHSVIEKINRLGDIQKWFPDPRFSSLWGINDNGELIIIDEARSRVVKKINNDFIERKPVFVENRTYLLAEEGTQWVSYDQRRFREEVHWESSEAVSAIHKGSTHWYFPADESEKLWYWWGDIPDDESLSFLSLDFVVKDSIWLSLKQGEGFACF